MTSMEEKNTLKVPTFRKERKFFKKSGFEDSDSESQDCSNAIIEELSYGFSGYSSAVSNTSRFIDEDTQ